VERARDRHLRETRESDLSGVWSDTVSAEDGSWENLEIEGGSQSK